MNKNKIFKIVGILLIIAAISTVIMLASNKNKDVDKDNTRDTPNNNVVTETKQIENNDTGILDERAEEYIYDLVSIVDIERDIDIIKKYPAYVLKSEIELIESDEEDKTAVEDEAVVSGVDDVTNSKKYNTIQYNHETVDRFLEDTQLKEDKITDFYVAYYVDSSYIAGVIKVDKEEIENTLNKLEEYKLNLIKEHAENKLYLEEYNGCIIITLGDNAEDLSRTIKDRIKNITEMLLNS